MVDSAIKIVIVHGYVSLPKGKDPSFHGQS